MVDFICNGLLELQWAQSMREIQNEKFFPTMGLEPSTLSLGYAP